MGGNTKVPRERARPERVVDYALYPSTMRKTAPTKVPVAASMRMGVAQLEEREGRRVVRTKGHEVGAARPAGGGRAPPLQVSAAVSKLRSDTVVLTVHTPPPVGAPSSQWTGRRTLHEQVLVVQTFAPLACNAVDQLAEAIERSKGNDPAYADALQTLKELHGVLGELIAQAERGRAMKALLSTFERKKANLRAVLVDNAQLLFVDPVRAIAAAQALEWVSSLTRLGDVESNATLVGAIYCALLGRGALARKKSSDG